ncbi:acetyl-CoA carboxylase carboxyl transferase, beta subunit [Sulfurimonas gotlandica GD1]|uniref:Acetyl-coenzyme A carboxylase carboxyl transferase subunit beta n=1 Tax=Sulfurimonas gotlandica (strain DSM 19862 / JCM 16533 / GD1) TaxID=929558 RepID=B6BK13_SULGG|nr:acetyl-CoA carboxylase, carboxyltransferase subunit beta [Sulfurimonas gotlandica]EDZ62568.1 acetyl-CoA carboxylase, carboxyl transferase, beta subunit [Sulfurimonas gotlandica GD1]EHP31103.1 acetyl-CoA carboxylase carboxyl transferase, beta subunit [Sulfurimonas gotlandica GD1]
MNLLSIFSFNSDKKQATKNESSSHWVKCKSCHSLMYYKEVENQNYVCPKCGFHLRIGVKERIELLEDEGTFVEFDANLYPIDPLKFVDSKPYTKRIEEGFAKTGRKSSVVSGEIVMNGVSAQIVIFDFGFMGGSLGSVEGEKIVRAVKRAIEKKEGLIILSASGGARMQESTFSLLQMSKTSAALAKLANHNLPYISVLTDPTMGGVSASFATLGDIIIAEPGALIGFAGQRVIEQTIGSALPDGFQRAEFLLEKGSVDMIVNRNELKKTLSDLLILLNNKAA